MLSKEFVEASLDLARSEIDRHGLPTKLHFDLSYDMARVIASKMGANIEMAGAGAALMDLKLGEAFKAGSLAEHVKMSAVAVTEFLSNWDLSDQEKKDILNCVEAHHGTVPFTCVEAEITANADCYRFLHPAGVIHYIGNLSKRGLEFGDIVKGAEAKLDEKYSILSLDYCKAELDTYYSYFKSIFGGAIGK